MPQTVNRYCPCPNDEPCPELNVGGPQPRIIAPTLEAIRGVGEFVARDQRRVAALRQCEARGGLTTFVQIPESLDVLTLINNRLDARAEPGADEPQAGRVGDPTRTSDPRAQLMAGSRPDGITAYTSVVHHLSTGRVSAVDLRIANFQSYDNDPPPPATLHDGRLLPDRDLPNGVFRYSIEAAGHPRCEGFRDMEAAFQKQGRIPGYGPAADFHAALVRDGRCVAIDYLGPAGAYVPPSFIQHEYRADLPDQGVRQDVTDLIGPDDRVIARLRSFSSITYAGGRCAEQPSDILEPFAYR